MVASEKQLAHLAKAREEKAKLKAEREAAMSVGPGSANKIFAGLMGSTTDEQVWLSALMTIIRNRNTVNPEGIKGCVTFADAVLDAYKERFNK